MVSLAAANMDRDRALIRAAMNYRSGADSVNSVYMGSMAIAGLYHELGLSYGAAGFQEALDKASRKQLNALLHRCKHTIDYMREHPTEKCPCCGQIRPVNKSSSP